jgi:glutamine amidotransferase
MPNKIVIVDYGMGNLFSVQKKMKAIGSDCIISSRVEDISAADKLILPGVGHFKNGVKNLKEKKLWEPLNHSVIIEKKPILGICLGMQLMTMFSEEGNETGFGWFDANVIRFKVNDTVKYKVPHMGWNNTILQKPNNLFLGLGSDANYYFVHSYYVKCNDTTDVLTTSNYDFDFTSSIQKKNIYGVQFHPEKSHQWGEDLLANFAKL